MASSGVSISSYVRLVRGNANFRRLWLAQIVSENGDWFYTLAIYSLLLDLTGKASSVALALVLQVLPHTLLGPLAGMVNDRFSRRKVMIATDLLRMVIVACMLLVRSPRHGVDDLSVAVSRNRHGGVFRAGAQRGHSQYCRRRRCDCCQHALRPPRGRSIWRWVRCWEEWSRHGWGETRSSC